MTRPGSTYDYARDGARLDKQWEIVKAYVLTRDWTTLGEISKATGYPEASVSARLRELRQRGYIVERRYVRRGLHEYRVFSAEPTQIAMFA